jgi:hypothetical protein
MSSRGHALLRGVVVAVLLIAVLVLNVQASPDWSGTLKLGADDGAVGDTSAAPICVRPPAGLISWWPGDGDANDIVDANHGTLQNGATFATGKVGQAFAFDGVDDFVEAPTSGFPTGSSDRTLELWIRIDASMVFTSEVFFVGYGAFGSAGQTYQLGANYGTTLFFSSWGHALPGPMLSTDEWHHVAVTNIGSMVALYVDGALVNTATWPAESIYTPGDTQFYIGKAGPYDSYRRLQGSVDEVSIYNRALSAQEILVIFRAGSAGKCTNQTPVALALPWLGCHH